MHPGDLDEVHAIERAMYPRPWPREMFVSELAQPDTRTYLVAERHGAVVGYAGSMLVADAAHITTVVVRDAHRRRGVGTALVVALLRDARRRGAQAATLEVRHTNVAARELYRGVGFVPVGVRPGYYDDTGEDAVIMWLHDLQSDDVAASLAAARARSGGS
ncbi:MAG: ribosomal protein S18-alanine N-acetyltransferase [Actinomycetota bacterium]|nr:ribosomal protein S18-alanine N-acetyltransferase [Actinomycetota bacterium]